MHKLFISESNIVKSLSLPYLFYRAYGLYSFKLDNLVFHFPDSMLAPSQPDLGNYLYDSVFYTYVSMYLTRRERDKFIKFFRKVY